MKFNPNSEMQLKRFELVSQFKSSRVFIIHKLIYQYSIFTLIISFIAVIIGVVKSDNINDIFSVFISSLAVFAYSIIFYLKYVKKIESIKYTKEQYELSIRSLVKKDLRQISSGITPSFMRENKNGRI